MSPGLFTNVIMAIFLRRVSSRCQGPSCPRQTSCCGSSHRTGVQVYSTGVQSQTDFMLWIKSQYRCTGVQYRCKVPDSLHVVDQVTVQVYSTGVKSQTVFMLWIKSQYRCTGVQYRCTVDQVKVQL